MRDGLWDKSVILLRACQFLCMLSFIFLLTHSTLILSYARKGLSSWAYSVVPVLLPFIILSKCWIHYGVPQLFYGTAKKLLPRHNSAALAVTILLLGLSTGFPVGAIFIRNYYETKILSKNAAEKLLPLCSFVSPMFIMGYVRPLTGYEEMNWILFLVSLYLPIFLYFGKEMLTGSLHTDTKNREVCSEDRESSVQDILLSSLEVVFTIGIYMMLFSILLGLALDEPIFQNVPIKILLSNLEVTTGVEQLSSLSTMKELTEPMTGMVIAATISAGGLCTMAQVYSILSDTSLSMKSYLSSKAGCASMSALLYLILFRICF
ncbi:MAG: hypothetical protein LUF92_02950 [Clostridiales bacterium]|nr:hypothetical protein [Clostridiales bacterium]